MTHSMTNVQTWKKSFVFAVACKTQPGSNDKRLFNCKRIPWHWYSAKAKNRLSNIFFCLFALFGISALRIRLVCLLVCSLHFYFISSSLFSGSLSLSFSHWHTNDFFPPVSVCICVHLSWLALLRSTSIQYYASLCMYSNENKRKRLFVR